VDEKLESQYFLMGNLFQVEEEVVVLVEVVVALAFQYWYQELF
jgi:hypothetical protein